jgi:hypothetical protein
VLAKVLILSCSIAANNRHFADGNSAGQTKPTMSNQDESLNTGTKTRKSRAREAVLIKVTPTKLAELIGDSEIGVSRKELRALVLSKASSDVLANAGL